MKAEMGLSWEEVGSSGVGGVQEGVTGLCEYD